MANSKKKFRFEMFVILLLFLVAFGGVLISRTYAAYDSTAEKTQRILTENAENYAATVNQDLSRLAAVLAPIRAYIEEDAEFLLDESERDIMLRSIYANSICDMVFISDENGVAIDEKGNAIDISGEAFFPSLLESDVSTNYIYTEKCVNLENGILVAKRIVQADTNRYIAAFYSLERFTRLVADAQFDGNSFYLVMDKNGKICSRAKTKGALKDAENLLDIVENSKTSEYIKLKNKLVNKGTGCLNVVVDGENRIVAVYPIDNTQLYVSIGYTESYYKTSVRHQWEEVRSLLILVAVALVSFMMLLLVGELISFFRTHESTKKLEKKADTDLLTGLYNKNATERKIKEYMELNAGDPGMMFLFDIDNFKKINDTMGHAFGDEVLRNLGNSIGTKFRVTDVVGRIGGDEFMVFLKHIDDPKIIEREANKLLLYFEDFVVGGYVKYSPTSSIGCALYPKDGDTFEKLYKAADTALYQSKKNGKNQLTFYNADQQGETKKG